VSSKVKYYRALIAQKKNKAHLNLDGKKVPVTPGTFKMANEVLRPFVELMESLK